MILTRGLGVIRANWRMLLQLSPIGLVWPAGMLSDWLWERIVLVELAGMGGVSAAMLTPGQRLLWHAWPSARLIGPALIVLVVVGQYRARQAGRLAGAASVVGLLLSIAITVWPEWLRLSSALAHGYPLSAMAAHIDLHLVAGVAFASALASLGAYGLLTPFPVGARGMPSLVRAKSDNFGHAAWLSMRAARKLFPGPDPAYGGIVVGEAYRVDEDRSSGRAGFKPGDRRSWGKGGQAPLLIDPCRHGPTHALVFAGSGGFKTTAIGVPTLLTWTGSTVVLDPSRELGPMTAGYRRRDLGHNVAMLDVATAAATGVNVLDWIDPTSPLAETHVEAVTGWIGGESRGQLTSGAEFFREGGRGLIACLLAHLLWDDALPPERRTLRELRRLLVTPEDDMRKLLEQVHALSSSAMARDLAGTLKGLVAETFSGVYANANKDTRWLSIPAYADLVSGGAKGTLPAFRTGDLCNGKLTVFIQIPLNALQATPAVGRVLVGSLLNAAYQADGRVTGRILFILDEVARLGYLQVLEQARDAGRKYGITLLLLYQSLGQLVGQWGREGKQAWYDSTSWRLFAAVQDPETARELSAMCGEYGVVATSHGDSEGSQARAGLASSTSGRSENRSEVKRALMKPDELLQDTRADEAFVLVRGSKPLRCGRAIWFRRPEWVPLVDENRFHTGHSNGSALPSIRLP